MLPDSYDTATLPTHPLEYRKYLAQYPGGTMFIFACHLIDLVVSLMDKPDRIVTFPRQTRSDVGLGMCDNGLIEIEYPKTTATIRTCSLEVEGYRRRPLVVCGDQGTIDIRPPQQPNLQLALSRNRDAYKKGNREVGWKWRVSSPQPRLGADGKPATLLLVEGNARCCRTKA